MRELKERNDVKSAILTPAKSATELGERFVPSNLVSSPPVDDLETECLQSVDSVLARYWASNVSSDLGKDSPW